MKSQGNHKSTFALVTNGGVVDVVDVVDYVTGHSVVCVRLLTTRQDFKFALHSRRLIEPQHRS